ncbi:DUF2807 domain-containing protein [Flavobacterium sp. xlx-214]|uniref:GIN domain-containing protein n=1 Tax=unclassified Flavobacterium TaxID=196869 RepID=UPI0013D74691|nr:MULTISPECIES: DUF2807 domain-containing protein [unclassified Flavobacterium]MBA5792252.1 DUF2807 domain-containing protein [Flavobacterium sp. xlx-221]QMI82431.1 DUF2807 domain-containing protein [Flavobacterium sp. xlx-214]
MKKSIVFLMFLIFGCSSEDGCFSKKGDAVTKIETLAGFHTIDIPMNVSVEIIPNNESKLEIHSFENRISALSFSVKDSVLIITNEVSCEMLKSYETAVLKIHTPTLKRINSHTQFNVYSNDTLRYPSLYLLTSVPNESGASTHFNLKLNSQKITVEDNQVGYFELKGKVNELDVKLYGGNGTVDAKQLRAKYVNIYHRSNQNIHLFPINKLEGIIASVGNVYLYNKPDTVSIERLYTGNVFYK